METLKQHILSSLFHFCNWMCKNENKWREEQIFSEIIKRAFLLIILIEFNCIIFLYDTNVLYSRNLFLRCKGTKNSC